MRKQYIDGWFYPTGCCLLPNAIDIDEEHQPAITVHATQLVKISQQPLSNP